MTVYRVSPVARRDLESVVLTMARADPRAAQRAVDELFATMEWLAGTPEAGAARPELRADSDSSADAVRVRTWELRDWLLVYAEPSRAGRDGAVGAPEPVTILRVLEPRSLGQG